MPHSLLSRTGPGSLAGRFTETVQRLAGMDTGPDTVVSDVEHDIETLLEHSPRVYRAEPSRLWDASLDDGHMDRQWSAGEKVVTDLDATDWELDSADITFYHSDDTLAYEARVDISSGSNEDRLFYVGELAYDLEEGRVDDYLDQLGDQETLAPGATVDLIRRSDEVAVSEWVHSPDGEPPCYRDSGSMPPEEALDHVQEVTGEYTELTEFDDGYRAVVHGEHPEYGDTSIVVQATGSDRPVL